MFRMHPDRFQANAPGSLVKVEHPDGPYWAFVPDPLPPYLAWDSELVQILSSADRALGELAGLGRTMRNPHLLVAPFIRREAVSSSRIEGTQADLLDLYVSQLSLPGVSPRASEADVQETLNYVHALEYGRRRLTAIPLSLRLIREVHERLLTGVRGRKASPGEFRTIQNMIGGAKPQTARFVPPPAHLSSGILHSGTPPMFEALEQLEVYLNADNHHPPLIRLALIHYQFEAIHPFLDGNGRLGRLLIALILIHWDLLPLPLLYLSAYFEQHRDAYYDRLLAVSQRAAWRDWVIFFLKGIFEQAQDASGRAKRLNDLRERWREQLHKSGRSGLPIRLVDYLFETPILTISEAERHLGVTYRSAKLAVDKLVALGVLAPFRDLPYARPYIAREILQVLGLGT
jgi:Fic family protein